MLQSRVSFSSFSSWGNWMSEIREIKIVSCSHGAGQWWSWDLNLPCQHSKPHASTTVKKRHMMPDLAINVASTIYYPWDGVESVRTQEIAFKIQNRAHLVQNFVWLKGNFGTYMMTQKTMIFFITGSLQNLL